LPLLFLPFACVADGHPLGTDGAVEIRVAVAGPLFASDDLDKNGHPTGARQTPFTTDVVLKITEDDEPAHGAFIAVRVEPAEALTIRSAGDATQEGAVDESGENPTCTLVDGAFRCRGNDAGLARLQLVSDSDWSGTANLVVSWANRTEEHDIVVLPAGLPLEATNFNLVGLSTGEEIAPTYLALECSVDSLPSDLGSKWPEGRIRSRELFVRATPPSSTPTIVQNAPVVVESLTSEGALSEDASCTTRTTRLRILFDQKGETPRFFACFSDLGGDVSFGVHSGQKVIDPGPEITVLPEPRLLRVRVVDGKNIVPIDFSPVDIFEVSAFDVTLRAIQVPLDLSTTGGNSLVLESASAVTAPENAAPVQVAAVPNEEGMSQLVVTPRLLAMPECKSTTITVTP